MLPYFFSFRTNREISPPLYREKSIVWDLDPRPHLPFLLATVPLRFVSRLQTPSSSSWKSTDKLFQDHFPPKNSTRTLSLPYLPLKKLISHPFSVRDHFSKSTFWSSTYSTFICFQPRSITYLNLVSFHSTGLKLFSQRSIMTRQFPNNTYCSQFSSASTSLHCWQPIYSPFLFSVTCYMFPKTRYAIF